MVTEKHESIWAASFSAEQREEQMDADSGAWNNIIGILLAIVTFGVSLSALTVWFISRFDV